VIPGDANDSNTAGQEQEGQNTLEARVLCLQQGIDALVSRKLFSLEFLSGSQNMN